MAFEKEAKVPRKKGSYAPDEGVGEMGGGGGSPRIQWLSALVGRHVSYIRNGLPRFTVRVEHASAAKKNSSFVHHKPLCMVFLHGASDPIFIFIYLFAK